MGHVLEDRSYRKGVLVGIWNNQNPSKPEWSSLPNDREAVAGYEFGFHNAEKARKALDDYNEWQQWQ